MEELNEDNLPTEKTGKDLFKDCFVDLDRPLKKLDVLLYYGFDDRNQRVAAITRGEYSCVVAPAKLKKSFNKSLMAAAYIGGNTVNYSEHIYIGEGRSDGFIIDLDTEQGAYYAQKTFQRVERLVGQRYKRYIPLESRKKSVEERIRLIDWIVYESPYKGNIDLIIIDGIADLVYNTNDIEAGAKLAEKMLKWTGEGCLHMILIIHKVAGADKARGHLGTAVTIKAETIIFMESITDDNGKLIEKNTVKIRCGYVRGLSFEDFYLSVNDEGLPFTHNEYNQLQKNEVPF
ncbi:MAG TPA: hypothetical protein DCG75_01620 [Bacteroidales bacterium]|nr:hypothetical protein [Bacteroidales bacterium]